MSALYFQSVWKETLSTSQKEQFHAFFQTLPTLDDKLTVTPFLIKYKKRGGLVATVLIQNGFSYPIQMNETNVQIKDNEQQTIAVETFEPKLSIPASSTMPWSFVFSSDSVVKREDVSKDWTVLFHGNLNE